MTSEERLTEIIGQLQAAGAGWADIARRLPEFRKLSHGRPAGRGVHRPWILLDEIDDYEAPPRLVRYENGVWFLKGTRTADIERTSP